LILGKLVRGFVPIPFRPRFGSYVVFFFRAIIYLGLLVSLRKISRGNRVYTYLLGSAFMVVLITTVMYYGIYRFSYLFEVPSMPLIAAALSQYVNESRRTLAS
jgi:hypothetical protein